ncbi:MAG: hypothetical protein LBG50_01720 [Clostridiales Family XIII bacterium]|nr:hypothetical protein [Clostridiales Family XIII bacterium]
MNDTNMDGGVIYPPTKEQIDDLRTHNVGMAIRLSAKLGRELNDWEYELFRKGQTEKVYKIVTLPNERFGIVG